MMLMRAVSVARPLQLDANWAIACYGSQSDCGAGNSGDAAMTVESILRRKGTDVATIEPDASIRRAADWLRVKNIGALVVTSGKAVLGLISEREIVHAFSRYGESATSMPVREIMRY